MADTEAQIPQFYAGRSVFITGGTGFLGKLIIERLLATCPGIGPIFVLVRQKRDRNSTSRIQEMKLSKVFDMIRTRCPHQLEKLKLVPGDVTLPRLGMSDQSIADIQEVSVVFHVAATLKFEEPLARAVSYNVKPVMELLNICDKLPQMKAFIHISTAYSYSDLKHVEEKVYPPPVPLDSLLKLTESLDEKLMAQITPQYISPKPNTYTFTKAMAEHVVATYPRKGKYVAAICRPSIVICTAEAPFPGWVDNFAGPCGMVAAVGAGLLHAIHGNSGARADMLPADVAASACVAYAWQIVRDNPEEASVLNISTYRNPTTWAEFEASLRRHMVAEPYNNALWFPSGVMIANPLLFQIMEFFVQTVPLHIAEYIAKILGIKLPINLISAERRMHAMTGVLSFFTLREWRFDTGKLQNLWTNMSPADRRLYNVDISTIEWDQLYLDFVKGTRKYLLKEDDEPAARKEARRRQRILKVMHYGLLIVLLLLLLRVFLKATVYGDLIYSGLSLVKNAVLGS